MTKIDASLRSDADRIGLGVPSHTLRGNSPWSVIKALVYNGLDTDSFDVVEFDGGQILTVLFFGSDVPCSVGGTAIFGDSGVWFGTTQISAAGLAARMPGGTVGEPTQAPSEFVQDADQPSYPLPNGRAAKGATATGGGAYTGYFAEFQIPAPGYLATSEGDPLQATVELEALFQSATVCGLPPYADDLSDPVAQITPCIIPAQLWTPALEAADGIFQPPGITAKVVGLYEIEAGP